MRKLTDQELSKRERQIMTVIYSKQTATARDVLNELADRPSYSGVRGLLRILEAKGLVKHKKRGRSYVYFPTTPRKKAMQLDLRRLLNTYFDNSVNDAIASIIHIGGDTLTEEDYDRLIQLIEVSRKGK